MRPADSNTPWAFAKSLCCLLAICLTGLQLAAAQPAVKAFADSLLDATMQEYDVPGAVFVVVRGDSIVLARGYGYADIESQRPVDPARTLFRVASVTKLFTTTAALQLVEQGLLDLDEDLRPLLEDLGIDVRYQEPLTPVHLLTHTSGFDGSDIGDATWDLGAVMTPGEFLQARTVTQAYPPGRFWRYSNFNMMLIGHLIEQRSGQPYAAYLNEQVLTPLAMPHSTAEQPLPSGLATAYDDTDDGPEVVPQDYSQVVPAGGLATTGIDMAHFMMAQLNGGRYGNDRILDSASVQTMQARHFSYHPHVPGHALGFREEYYGSQRWHLGTQRALSHDGSRPGFSSDLVLLPDRDLGIFVAANRRSGSFCYRIVAAILAAYAPGGDLKAPEGGMPTTDTAQWVGTYRSVAFPRGTLEKFGGFIVKRFYAEVARAEDGTLRLDEQELVETGPGLFQVREDGEFVGFRNEGERPYLFLRRHAYEKLRWYETRGFMWLMFIAYNLVFLSVALGWPLARRLRKRSLPDDESRRGARWLGWSTSVVGLLFLVGLVLTTETTEAGSLFDYGIPPVLTLLFVLPLLVALGTAGLLVCTVSAWWRRWWDLAGRIHYTLLTGAALAFLWWTHAWNLLGFQF